jgi:hypothetical protein
MSKREPTQQERNALRKRVSGRVYEPDEIRMARVAARLILARGDRTDRDFREAACWEVFHSRGGHSNAAAWRRYRESKCDG